MADGNPDTGRALLGPERDPGRRWYEHIVPFETLDQSYLEQFRNVGESHPRRKKIKSKLRELKKIGFHLRTILGRNICFQINRLGRNIKIQTKEERKRKKKQQEKTNKPGCMIASTQTGPLAGCSYTPRLHRTDRRNMQIS